MKPEPAFGRANSTEKPMTRQHCEINLGEKYTYKLHDITGVATIHSRFISGCDRVMLEHKDGGDIKEFWVDVNMLEDANGNPVVKQTESKAPVGGPQKAPPQRVGY